MTQGSPEKQSLQEQMTDGGDGDADGGDGGGGGGGGGLGGDEIG